MKYKIEIITKTSQMERAIKVILDPEMFTSQNKQVRLQTLQKANFCLKSGSHIVLRPPQASISACFLSELKYGLQLQSLFFYKMEIKLTYQPQTFKQPQTILRVSECSQLVVRLKDYFLQVKPDLFDRLGDVRYQEMPHADLIWFQDADRNDLRQIKRQLKEHLVFANGSPICMQQIDEDRQDSRRLLLQTNLPPIFVLINFKYIQPEHYTLFILKRELVSIQNYFNQANQHQIDDVIELRNQNLVKHKQQKRPSLIFSSATLSFNERVISAVQELHELSAANKQRALDPFSFSAVISNQVTVSKARNYSAKLLNLKAEAKSPARCKQLMHRFKHQPSKALQQKPAAKAASNSVTLSSSDLHRIDLIAQVQNEFIIGSLKIKNNLKLIAIDQHAMHERVNLDQLEALYLGQVEKRYPRYT